ncbi:MAG: glucose-1-phosphate cytidylyltransferase [Ruminococcus sp.]|jgi:glucose-1-phosphate cytidylyltransferase|nr:glucose-1-phosphate cytidylyltransferase [Ruminococcus sp.]
MKTVILAGGFGTRISEESHLKPKPMLQIGSQPILWHIMKHYSSFGHNEFIILAGYKQDVIKEYFANYFLHRTDVTFDFVSNNSIYHNSYSEPWKVTVADTGFNTMTGGRLLRARKYIGDEPFFLTYGDGISDIDINALLKFHTEQKKTATLTAVRTEQRFGILDLNEDGVSAFREKNDIDGDWINGGFFVFEKEIFSLLKDDETVLEKAPLETLAKNSDLNAYRHTGFWKCMDTKRDMDELNLLWDSGNAPWGKSITQF